MNSRSFETRHTAKIFADSIKRTSKILKEEKTKHLKDDGKRYLQQLVFMTKYLMQNQGLSIEKRMQRIRPKLKELEAHQMHQLYVLEHKKKAGKKHAKCRKTKKKKALKKAKARKH